MHQMIDFLMGSGRKRTNIIPPKHFLNMNDHFPVQNFYSEVININRSHDYVSTISDVLFIKAFAD